MEAGPKVICRLLLEFRFHLIIAYFLEGVLQRTLCWLSYTYSTM